MTFSDLLQTFLVSFGKEDKVAVTAGSASSTVSDSFLYLECTGLNKPDVTPDPFSLIRKEKQRGFTLDFQLLSRESEGYHRTETGVVA